MIERILQKIGRINQYITTIESLRDDCLERFTNDPVYRGALLHYLYLLTDSCIALAEMTVKHKKLRVPQSYQEVFDILGEGGVLEADFAYRFARIAGFRNFLAHDYEGLDSKIICENAVSKLPEIREFMNQIRNSLDL